MNTRQLTILAILAAGCAHGKSEAESARAAQDERLDERAESATGDERSDQDSERVEVPERGERPNRLASNADELPGAGSANKSGPKSAEELGTDADNTRVNERDRESSALTPMDQGSGEGDMELTQRVRKALIGEESLSFSAKNVKVITRDGQVTLRGSVNNERERTTIERITREIAGSTRVQNQLEVSD